MATQWKNWARNVVFTPAEMVTPRTLDELVLEVSRALTAGRSVRVAGSGHSFTPVVQTSGLLVDNSKLAGIRHVDYARSLVVVGAGTVLSDLNNELAGLGLALPNLGDITAQTVAGSISTSTHGTGAQFFGLAAQVRAITLVDGFGRVRHIDDPDGVRIVAVNVGALGVVVEYTLEVVPAFRLEAREGAMRVEELMDCLDEVVDTTDHFEFYWIPHTKWCLTKRNSRTDEAPAPLPRWRHFAEKTVLENVGFGAVCRLGSIRPSLIPRLATVLPASGSRAYRDQSHKVFASARLVRFKEMEFAVPRSSGAEVLTELRQMVERQGHMVSFPVEVRFTKADDVALSTSYGRDSCYIAVHMYRPMDHTAYFNDVQSIMVNHGGRPHWGKMHTLDHEHLKTLYPRMDDFLARRTEYDPQRVFSNDYVKKVLGS
ncbi:MAG: FAD-binding protein [Actinobacteria bacterium]|nr:FAD-binding protein [Actinomycetota bacterium]